MKSMYLCLSAGLISMQAGCASTPVALTAVGPNPSVPASQVSNGRLQVFSSLVGRSEGDNPAWYQHTGYEVYNVNGELVKHVDNTVGRYAEAPRQVTLTAGRYLVKAQAKDYFWVNVPVLIERGQTTRVHLDDHWQIPADVPKMELVSLPNGNPVGWRAGARGASGMD